MKKIIFALLFLIASNVSGQINLWHLYQINPDGRSIVAKKSFQVNDSINLKGVVIMSGILSTSDTTFKPLGDSAGVIKKMNSWPTGSGGGGSSTGTANSIGYYDGSGNLSPGTADFYWNEASGDFAINNFSGGAFFSANRSSPSPIIQMGADSFFVGGATTPNTSGFRYFPFTGTGNRMVIAHNNGVFDVQAIPGGSVTSVATGYALSGGPITTTGTLSADTSILVNKTGPQSLTNKTIVAGSNTITGITNANLSGSAGITNANLAGGIDTSKTDGVSKVSAGINMIVGVAGKNNIVNADTTNGDQKLATQGDIYRYAAPISTAVTSVGSSDNTVTSTGTTAIDLTVPGLAYHEYVAILNQSSTSAPVPTILFDNLSAVVSGIGFNYLDVGRYTIERGGFSDWDIDKTIVWVSSGGDGVNNFTTYVTQCFVVHAGSPSIHLNTYNFGDAGGTDELLKNTMIIIRVYN